MRGAFKLPDKSFVHLRVMAEQYLDQDETITSDRIREFCAQNTCDEV